MKDFSSRLDKAKQTLCFTKFPTQIILETVAGCNLRCLACPSHLLLRKKGEMAPQLFHKIIDEVAKENPDTEIYPAYMGEPLLYQPLFELIRYAKARGLTKIFLNTNGMLLDDNVCKHILDCELDRVIVSIDGFSAQSYEERRVGGNYRKVVDNTLNLLRHLQQRKNSTLQIWAQMIVDQGNRKEEAAFIEFWRAQGAWVKIRPQLSWGNRVGDGYLSRVQLDRITCPWLMRQIVIAYDGKAVMCDADHEAKCDLGDLNSHTVKEIWNSSFRELRERHIRGDYSHPLCQDCHDWKVGKSELYPPAESHL